jgi:polysaccharide biosynthesis transport protein
MPDLNNNPPEAFAESPSGGISLTDIYFILFRRKWIILTFTLLGVVAAAFLFVNEKPVFRSEGKLMVRYIVENKALVPVGDDSQIRSNDRDNNIINSEIEILTSADLLTQVAEAVGPAKILANMQGGDDKFLAAAVLAKAITIEVPTRSSIIKVTFRHSDPAVITPVLERLIDLYLKRHAEIHRGLGSLDIVLSQQTDQMRSRLNETEDELRKMKAKAGVVSIEETRTAYIQEISSLRRELFNTEAALAETRASLGTNAVASTNGAPASAEIPLDIITQYREIVTRSIAARDREFGYRTQFSDDNPLVKRAREQVADLEQKRNGLELQYPGLSKVLADVATAAAPGLPFAIDPNRAAALSAKEKTLKAQLAQIHADLAKLDDIENPLKQLQRQRDLEETNFRYFSAGLERSRFDETLGAGRNSNISIVQNPTPPRKDDSRRLKLVAGALGGAVTFGLALAVVLELFIDHSVRRAHDVSERLGLPLFVTIPYVNGKAMRRLAAKRQKRLTADGKPQGPEVSGPAATVVEADHPMRSMFEALRDRMLLHFGTVTHKPKLVGISSCSHNGGGTTIAAGLAAALSETGEGKVLLVDMQQPKGVAHPFFRGKHACEIEDVLGQETRDAGMVQDNLYVAAANGHERRLGALAKHVSTLVPRFKASDYDFIIFDMPRVSPTSASLRLSTMMDLVLLVAEAEKVPRKALKDAHSLLEQAGTEAHIVLNKVRKYVPAGLSGEL